MGLLPGENASYRLPFAEECCPGGREHHSLSEEKKVNEPAYPGLSGWGRGNKMIGALQSIGFKTDQNTAHAHSAVLVLRVFFIC